MNPDELEIFNNLSPTQRAYLNTLSVSAPTASGASGSTGVSGVAAGTDGVGGSGFGWNMDTARLALGGLQTLGSLFMANRSYGLAKDQFNFQKDLANTNLTNQIQSYNTSLADRAAARAHMEGRDQAYVDDYVANNRLTRS